ncbi:MAG: alpha/beta hydrolase-fold protein [Lactobacillus sp.]|nr:alpha/beta hydrolase-fold protein [Lactobacillus sp.]
MTVLTANTFSPTLNAFSKTNIIIPNDYEANPAATLWLLNGYGGDEQSWLLHTAIMDLAETYHLAVIMPNGQNSFYVNAGVLPYEDYFIQEFMPRMQKMFSLPTEQAKNFIMGNSMGGFGALRFGLTYPDKFQKIAALSGVVNLPNFFNNPDFPVPKSEVAVLFPDDTMFADQNNLEFLFNQLTAAQQATLQFYTSCGTGDSLFKDNEYLAHRFSRELNYVWRPVAGDHSWPVWAAQLDQVLAWLVQNE